MLCYANFGKLLDCSLIIQLYICKFSEALAILIGCNGPYPSFQVWIWLISDDFCQLFFFSLVVICHTYITYLFLNHTITYILSRVIVKPDDFVMGSSGKNVSARVSVYTHSLDHSVLHLHSTPQFPPHDHAKFHVVHFKFHYHPC